MSMLDRLLTIVNDKGWLAISSIYFDNNLVIQIPNSWGAIAYSPSDDCFYTYNAIDQGYTEIIEAKLIVFDNHHIGQQQALTVAESQHMQHFDVAQYTHYRSYDNNKNIYPYPDLPSPSDLDAYTKDEETGLYTGGSKELDVATMKNGEKKSVWPFFDKDLDVPYSAADVEFWKSFQEGHKMFLDMLKEGYGITDAI